MIAGLRSLTAPAVVSWAAHIGWLHLENTWPAFLGYAFTPYILSILAIGELIADKLPKTPSRKAPMPFAARVVIGALCGAALGAPGQALVGDLRRDSDRLQTIMTNISHRCGTVWIIRRPASECNKPEDWFKSFSRTFVSTDCRATKRL
jgi:hypothetical protein